MVLRVRGPLPLLAGLAASAVFLLATAPVVLAKEGVEAKLTTPFPRDAKAGERITVAWTLSFIDQDGKEQPFNAEGVFVRLLSATRGTPSIAYASNSNTGHPTGEYRAEVTVPAGGVGEIQIGIMGSSEVLFPFRSQLSGMRPPNAPVAATAHHSGPSLIPPLVAGAALLLVLGVLGATLQSRILPKR